MRKRLLALGIYAVFGIAIFSSCSNDQLASKNASSESDEQRENAADDDKPVGDEIIIRVTRWGDNEQLAEVALVDEFNQNNDKNIKIIYDSVPGDGYGDRLTTSFSSGDGYDVFLSGEGDFFKWVDKGLTMPMDELIRKDTEYTIPLADTLLKMGQVNGEQHYIVGGENPILLYYNRDLFDQLNVPYPSDEWTWDDLFEAADKLTVKNNDGSFESYGFNAQNWSYAVLTYLESLGLNFMNEDGSIADGYLNSPKVADALDRYFGMTREPNKVSPAAADLDSFGNAAAMMNSGKLAMFVSGGWDLKLLQDAGTNYGTALIPSNHTSYICASGFAIGTYCKNPEAAWEVVKLLTGERASDLRQELEGALPTTKVGLNDLFERFDERDKAFIRSLEYGVQPIGMRSELGSKINEITGDIFERIIFQDGSTMDILNDALKQVSQ